MWCIPFHSSFLFSALFFQHVHAFAFITSQPRQCGELQFDWVGGTPPFTALVIVPFGIMRNISIPAQAWNERDQSGTFSYLLNLNQDQQVVFSMGDATGSTAGGVTDVITVSAPIEDSQPCNTSNPSPDFTFETDLPLLQCKNFSFNLFGTGVGPVSVLVTVPHGESFTFTAPIGYNPFLWKANLTAGTNVIFSLTDAVNRTGGTSHVLDVGISDDSSCLEAPPASAPPTRLPKLSTTSSPNPSRTSTPSSGSNSGSKNNKPDNKMGVIIGASIGGTVAILAIMALIFYLTKRKQKGGWNGAKPIDLTASPTDVSTFVLYHDQAAPPPYSGDPNGVVPPTSRSDWSGPDTTSSSTAAAVAALAGAEAPAGVMDTKANHSVLSLKREAMQQQESHLYFDSYTRDWQRQPGYDFESYADTAFREREIGNTLESSSFPAPNAGTSASDNSEATSPRSRKSQLTSPFTTRPLRHFIVHTDMEDEVIELPPMYSNSGTRIPGLPSAVLTGGNH